ncbi:hypothetical protein MKW98_020641 [Papaver atlanticum]|uniref:Uncharacterized protein n=1 Tax=Papaver atlanticum TaxID=357466 RepID=A0AAD4XXE9_9MAGN|nr:hypothetical protein MKW98_020641 [Papaver atlanticum]
MRMFNFTKITKKEDYKYSDANRERMRDILNNPTNFSEDEKINTLLSFHKDTCVNEFESVLVDLEFENRRTCQDAIYWHLRAKIRLLETRAAMSSLLEPPNAQLLPEDIKNWMLQKLENNDKDDDDDEEEEEEEDEDEDVHDNDKERLLGAKTEIGGVLAYLQRLGADMSKYQDSDGDEDPKFMDDKPITQATIDQYMALEEEVTRLSDKIFEVLEDVNPIAIYMSHLKRDISDLEKGLTLGTLII